MTIQQDVDAVRRAAAARARRCGTRVAPGRHAWVHVARGQVELGGEQLEAGDAVAISDARGLELSGGDSSEVLLFDLA